MVCKIFGHKPPVYAEKGWYSPGQEYMTVRLESVDGIGRQHAVIYAECARCHKQFKVGRIHVPKWEAK